MSVEQVYKFFLHFIVYLAVSLPARLPLRYDIEAIRFGDSLHLLIEVPDEKVLRAVWLVATRPKRTCLVLYLVLKVSECEPYGLYQRV